MLMLMLILTLMRIRGQAPRLGRVPAVRAGVGGGAQRPREQVRVGLRDAPQGVQREEEVEVRRRWRRRGRST